MLLEAGFTRRDCLPRLLRLRCTRGKREPRIIGLQAHKYFEALQEAYRHQKEGIPEMLGRSCQDQGHARPSG